MSYTITQSLFFPHSNVAVWEFLINSELMAQWLMENDFLPAVGHEFQFRTRPMPAFGFDGIISCKVMELVPCKKLAYSWKGGAGNRPVKLDSMVVWTLEPKEGGTALHLEHSGFQEPEDIQMFKVMEDGWIRNMKRMAELLKP